MKGWTVEALRNEYINKIESCFLALPYEWEEDILTFSFGGEINPVFEGKARAQVAQYRRGRFDYGAWGEEYDNQFKIYLESEEFTKGSCFSGDLSLFLEEAAFVVHRDSYLRVAKEFLVLAYLQDLEEQNPLWTENQVEELLLQVEKVLETGIYEEWCPKN